LLKGPALVGHYNPLLILNAKLLLLRCPLHEGWDRSIVLRAGAVGVVYIPANGTNFKLKLRLNYGELLLLERPLHKRLDGAVVLRAGAVGVVEVVALPPRHHAAGPQIRRQRRRHHVRQHRLEPLVVQSDLQA
jgi:hypothetical protein